MPVFRANNWDHPDTWKDLLFDHFKEINFSPNDINLYQDLNLPMVMWNRKDCVLDSEMTVTYFKGKVTMEYFRHPIKVRKCEMTYNDFLMMFIDAGL